jgi:purine-binding chemotaxis protein CheW
VGSRACAIPIEHVRETMRPLAIERLPNVPASVLGVSVVRGSPVPVVAAALLLGVAATTPPKRFVSLTVADRHVALAVDEVVGVRVMNASAWTALPPLLQGADDDAVGALALLDGALLVVLESSRLVPDDAWAALAAEVAP